MNAHPMTGRLDEIASALCNLDLLIDAHQRAQTRAERRALHGPMLENTAALEFLIHDARQQLPHLLADHDTTENAHAHH